MQSHRKRKSGPSKKHAVLVASDDEVPDGRTYPTLPKFDFDESFDYGSYWQSPPRNRHFVPRYAKLKKAGGKSISFYEKWRQMQYEMNCVMKKFLDLANVNLSVLPPCSNYNLWRRPSWRRHYDRPLDEDPCPDCDVRFRWEKNEWVDKIAPASILSQSRWNKNTNPDSIIMIGLPQHIAIGYLRLSDDMAIFEFFDPAGPTGDREGVKELRKWCEKKLPKQIKRSVEFHQVHRKVNFQHDLDDVMCQTWIWYWVYFRVVRKLPPREIANFVKSMVQEDRSLRHIHKFNCWLSDLHNVGFLNRETQSQTDIAQIETPRDPRYTRTSSRTSSTSARNPDVNRSKTEASTSSLSRHRCNRQESGASNLVRTQKTKKTVDRQALSTGTKNITTKPVVSKIKRVTLSRAISPTNRVPLVRKEVVRKSTSRSRH